MARQSVLSVCGRSSSEVRSVESSMTCVHWRCVLSTSRKRTSVLARDERLPDGAPSVRRMRRVARAAEGTDQRKADRPPNRWNRRGVAPRYRGARPRVARGAPPGQSTVRRVTPRSRILQLVRLRLTDLLPAVLSTRWRPLPSLANRGKEGSMPFITIGMRHCSVKPRRSGQVIDDRYVVPRRER